MDLSEKIKALAEAAAKSTDEDERVAAAQTGALPVYRDLGGMLLLHSDGAVLVYQSESRQVRPAEEPWRTLGLVQAARRFDELSELMPQMPASAKQCGACGGSGTLVGDLPCAACHGLGWIAPVDDGARAGTGKIR